jgi:virginiamycin B lyase
MSPLVSLVLIPALLNPVADTARDARTVTVEIREWTVPWERSRPRDPYQDAQGRVWFVGQQGNYVAFLNPADGSVKRFELDSGVHPHNLIVEPGGTVWYAGNRAGHIGKLDPATGAITKYPMPDPAVRDPHTLIFDSKGDIWFTAQGAGHVGKLETRTGKVHLLHVAQGSRTYGIVVDANDRPWFNHFGTNKVGTVDPATMTLKEYVLPAANARGRRIHVTADGGVWYVDYARHSLARLDPATGNVEEWPTPSANSRPYAMAKDDKDRIWLVESGVQPNRFVGFDPATKQFFSNTAIGSGGGTVRHMQFNPATREIWFGTDVGTIGRAKVPE